MDCLVGAVYTFVYQHILLRPLEDDYAGWGKENARGICLFREAPGASLREKVRVNAHGDKTMIQCSHSNLGSLVAHPRPRCSVIGGSS